MRWFVETDIKGNHIVRSLTHAVFAQLSVDNALALARKLNVGGTTMLTILPYSGTKDVTTTQYGRS